ncbi:MAG TPA: hypothetical protein ENO31_00090 [Thermoprotei archaeon]|nr:hypothetical protein [Thermoprotei archaeon]
MALSSRPVKGFTPSLHQKVSSAAVKCPRLNSDVIFVLKRDGSSEVDGCPYYRDGKCAIPYAHNLLKLPAISDRYRIRGSYVCPLCGHKLELKMNGIYQCPVDKSMYLPPDMQVPCLFYKSSGRTTLF